MFQIKKSKLLFASFDTELHFYPPMTRLHNSLLYAQTALVAWHEKTRKEMETFSASFYQRSGWSVALDTVSSALNVSICLKSTFPL